MPVLVDTNVILDLITDDPKWAAWSQQKLAEYQEGGLWINSIVFAELCVWAESAEEVLEIVDLLRLKQREISPQGLFLAAQAFRAYRKREGTKISPLPDFYLGGHAADSGVPLLTRDPARYQTYFPTVTLICPD